MYPNFYLSFVLSKEKNNLNLVRLLAAMAVIYGHSFGLIPNPAGLDIIYHITGVYAAEWGVKTFFFLSGLLVVNSILSDRNVYSYMIKRVMRIWPALIFVVIGTVFIIGPINTQLPLNEYFSNTDLYFYIKSILTFDIFGKNNIGLPGIFEHNPFPVAVNAPLWTISIEVFAYVVILALYLIGAFNQRFALIVFLVFLVDSLLPERLIFWWMPRDDFNLGAIPFCFALGGLLAVCKDQVRIDFSVVFGFVVLALLFRGGEYHKYLVYTTMFMLYFSALPVIVRLPKIPDISYGVYLWGWPVQQTMVNFFPTMNYWGNLLVTYVTVCVLALISWFLVEKPSIRLGRYWSDYFRKRVSISNT